MKTLIICALLGITVPCWTELQFYSEKMNELALTDESLAQLSEALSEQHQAILDINQKLRALEATCLGQGQNPTAAATLATLGVGIAKTQDLLLVQARSFSLLQSVKFEVHNYLEFREPSRGCGIPGILRWPEQVIVRFSARNLAAGSEILNSQEKVNWAYYAEKVSPL